MEKILILIRGVSGSGKTTLAKLLQDTMNAVSISADAYFGDNGDEGDEYHFDAKKLPNAHAFCQDWVRDAMKGKMDRFRNSDVILVHNTFTQEWEMEPYFKLAKKYGYKVITLVVENRHNSKSIHDSPDSVIEKQKERFEIKL